MRTIAAALGVALGVCLLLLLKPASQRAAALTPYEIGDVVALSSLCSSDGTPISESDLLATPGSGLLLQFWSSRCPVTRGYEDRVAALADSEAGHAIAMARVAADDRDTDDPTSTEGPLLRDPSGTLLKRLGVDKTPHFVLLDPQGHLLYTGAFDANLLGDNPPDKAYVERAVEQLLAGEPISVPRAETFGTVIRRGAAR